ncbi:MAG TPA: hypothetical protein VM939_06790 [Gemmatimonadaceae bacterium]|nr:hypothetical protein [Gemmatimonadaceae bacterium]
MLTKGAFMSHADIIQQYLSERYPAKRFVPFALFLAAAGMLAVPGAEDFRTAATLRSGLLAAFTGYLIVLVLRIWDDLQDRKHDAHVHPDRITLRDDAPRSLRYLARLSASGAILILAAGSHPAPRLLVLALLAASLGVWYGARELSKPMPVIGAHIVLIKYPVIAYIVAPGSTGSARELLMAAPMLIAVYLLLCIHEVLDDPALRRSRTARGVLIAESAVMVPLTALLIASALELDLSFFGRGSLP